MGFEERRAWVMALVAVGAYGTYVAVVLGRADGVALPEVPYAGALLWSIAWAVAVSIVLNIAMSAVWRDGADERDQRDREIHRLGQYIGQSFLVVGGVAALGMALADWDTFWIANVLYLGFVLSAVIGSVAKLVAYRRGFQTW